MQQRYYDPMVGRFLSVDPVAALDGGPLHFSRYAYAYDNPHKFSDPDGRQPLPEDFKPPANLPSAPLPTSPAQAAGYARPQLPLINPANVAADLDRTADALGQMELVAVASVEGAPAGVVFGIGAFACTLGAVAFDGFTTDRVFSLGTFGASNAAEPVIRQAPKILQTVENALGIGEAGEEMLDEFDPVTRDEETVK